MNYISIITTTCDLCRRKVSGFYCKNGEWWDKYADEGKNICLDCIKGKVGFAEDFRSKAGVSITEYEKLNITPTPK